MTIMLFIMTILQGGAMNWFYEACRDEYTYPRCGKGAIKAEVTDAEVRYCDIHMHHNIEIIYVIDAKMEVRLYKSENDFMSMTIPFAALKAQKAMKAECRNADFKIMC